LVLSAGAAPHLPVQGWAWTIFLGVVTTGLAGLLYLGGLRTTNTTVASLCGLVEPLTASLLGWGLLGERLSRISWAGAGVLLTALAFISAEDFFRAGKDA
jgi:DME family drug/metabolite transporter